MTQPAASLWHDPSPKLIAILRGITPDEVIATVDVLLEAGFRAIEVPLNSPDALTSIARAVDHAPAGTLIGAGTVLTAQQVTEVLATGARLIVAPNADPTVIAAAAGGGAVVVPGVFTATEAFSALNAGATALKIFPAATLGPSGIGALRAVLPPDVPLCAVGGVGPGTFADYWAAGVRSFGLGSNLYRPGATVDEVRTNAQAAMAAFAALTN